MFARIRRWWKSRPTNPELELPPLTDAELEAAFNAAWSDPNFYWFMTDWGRSHKAEVKDQLMPHLKETYQTQRIKERT